MPIRNCIKAISSHTSRLKIKVVGLVQKINTAAFFFNFGVRKVKHAQF